MDKDNQYNKQYSRHIRWSEEDNCWVCVVPELPGCQADGDTPQEVWDNAERIIKEWKDTAKQLGRDIPNEPLLKKANVAEWVTEKMVKEYLEKIYKEMDRRNITGEDIPRVIAKTGFMDALAYCPEEQLNCSISDAVDEILVIAAKY